MYCECGRQAQFLTTRTKILWQICSKCETDCVCILICVVLITQSLLPKRTSSVIKWDQESLTHNCTQTPYALTHTHMHTDMQTNIHTHTHISVSWQDMHMNGHCSHSWDYQTGEREEGEVGGGGGGGALRVDRNANICVRGRFNMCEAVSAYLPLPPLPPCPPPLHLHLDLTPPSQKERENKKRTPK